MRLIMHRRRAMAAGIIVLMAAGLVCPRPVPAASVDDAQLTARIDRSLSAAGEWMAARQSPDGAWRSDIYGFFKDGPSLTAHVLSAMYFIPRGGAAVEKSVQKGADYFVSLVDEQGKLSANLQLIYPVYTAAEASRMVIKPGATAQRLGAQSAWLAYLRGFQMVESLGWTPADMEYGGWGFSQQPARKKAPGQYRGAWDWPNLTTTVYALGALHSAHVPRGDAVYGQVLVFVQRCQNYIDPPNGDEFADGGFYFSPCAAMFNKAGSAVDAKGRPRLYSYGSMTCDGLRALLACGLPVDHPRVAAARRWIERNFSVEHNPGHFAAGNEDLRDATYYYYLWSLSHALMHLRSRQIDTAAGRIDWPAAVADAIIKRQRADGAWINRFTDGREDEPLVATPFAASALAICRDAIAPAAAPAGCRASPVAAGAKLEKLAGDCDGVPFEFTEGPAADAQGNVYFTDQPNDRILKWSVDGKISTFMRPCGRSNGLCFDNQGRLLVCADEHNELWQIDPATKKVTVLLKDFQGKLFNGPNDVWVRPDGGIYFTDPYYPRDYWKRGPKQMGECVYFVTSDYKQVKRVADDLVQPNGIIGTPDGKTLYVADIRGRKTYAYDIQGDGSLAGKRLFCAMGSDGMTIDDEGNVYLSGRGVFVFDKAGQQIAKIDVPEGWVGNICFGGKDRQTLFITACKGLYGIRMRTHGAGSQ